MLLLGFGVSFGLNYGTSNHPFYLLPAERLLHPELWKNDWAVTQNHHYHFVFARLAAALLTLDPSGWIFAISNVLAVALTLGCVWALLRLLVSAERATLALLMVLLIASGTRTGGPGTSYLFSDVFQPNTLGAAWFTAACWLTVKGATAASGLALALAGGVHANYLVLCVPVFGVAQLLGGRQDLARRLLWQLGPALLVLLAYLPAIRATGTSPLIAEAQRVYQDIRSPHHYRVETFAHQFLPWAGWQLVGASALWAMSAERVVVRRLLGLLAGFWALIVPSLALALAVWRPLIQLYPWRLTPNCELLAQAGFAALVAERLLDPAARAPGKAQRTLMLLGLALVVAGAVRGDNAIPAVACALGVLSVLGAERIHAYSSALRHAPVVLGAALLLGIVAGNARHLSRLPGESSLLEGRNGGVEELCRWIEANTHLDEVLLTPPLEEGIRFQCRRAIVVDWKSAPMVPAEVLAWYERVTDVMGGVRVQRPEDLRAYLTLDREGVERLREKYGFDLVIAHREREPALGLAPAFRGSRFVAYRLPPAAP